VAEDGASALMEKTVAPPPNIDPVEKQTPKPPNPTQQLLSQVQHVMPEPGVAEPAEPGHNPRMFADPDNLDLLWPVETRTISSAWGPRIRTTTVVIKTSNGNRRVRRPYTSTHKGIDLTAPLGFSIFAAMDGRIIEVGRDKHLGRFIKIDHGNGVETLYGHNSANLVAVGDSVLRGQIIGKVGSTGRSTGPHVHFEVRIKGQNVNPGPWLNDTEELSAEILAYNEKVRRSTSNRR
jgi:murein DD-endopeptidase MepM/ murein hydrolase activator NlpD